MLFGDKAVSLKGLSNQIRYCIDHLQHHHTLGIAYGETLSYKEQGEDDTIDLLRNLLDDGDDLLDNLDIIRYNENSGEPRLKHNVTDKGKKVETFYQVGCSEGYFSFDIKSDSNSNLKFGNFDSGVYMQEPHNYPKEINIAFGVFDFVKVFKGKVQRLLEAIEKQRNHLKGISFVKAFGDNKELMTLISEIDKAREKQVKSIEKQIGLIKHLFKDIL